MFICFNEQKVQVLFYLLRLFYVQDVGCKGDSIIHGHFGFMCRQRSKFNVSVLVSADNEMCLAIATLFTDNPQGPTEFVIFYPVLKCRGQ